MVINSREMEVRVNQQNWDDSQATITDRRLVVT